MRARFIFLFALSVLQSVYADVTIEGNLVGNGDAHYLQYVRHMAVPFASQTGPTWEAGNDVSGKTPAEVQAIIDAIKALETEARQREIFDRMKAAPTENFAFRDVAHAKSVVLQRLETMEMMANFNVTRIYDYANHQPDPHPASTTAGHWETGSRVKFYFRQESGSAYEAITQLCAPGTKTYGECLGGIIACIWWGASRGLGETGFNSLYPGLTALDMDLWTNSSGRRNTRAATDVSLHIPGDWLYFKNYNYTDVIRIREFKKKGWLDGKRSYFWSGENALYVGDNKYEGLGVSERTADEMREEIRQAYNRDLAKIIDEVGKLGGTFNGVEIKEIEQNQAQSKIQAINVLRVTN